MSIMDALMTREPNSGIYAIMQSVWFTRQPTVLYFRTISVTHHYYVLALKNYVIKKKGVLHLSLILRTESGLKSLFVYLTSGIGIHIGGQRIPSVFGDLLLDGMNRGRV